MFQIGENLTVLVESKLDFFPGIDDFVSGMVKMSEKGRSPAIQHEISLLKKKPSTSILTVFLHRL